MTDPAPRNPVQAVVALGANLGDSNATLLWALGQLRTMSAGSFCASGLWRTAPQHASGPDYLNAVARFDTALAAPQLLDTLQDLENAAGRQRPYANAPRTLDLDLIFYGQAQIQSPRLTVPHPRWRERAFVLMPLSEVLPQFVSEAMRAAVAGQRAERVDHA